MTQCKGRSGQPIRPSNTEGMRKYTAAADDFGTIRSRMEELRREPLGYPTKTFVWRAWIVRRTGSALGRLCAALAPAKRRFLELDLDPHSWDLRHVGGREDLGRTCYGVST